jgi:hypothetical protein
MSTEESPEARRGFHHRYPGLIDEVCVAQDVPPALVRALLELEERHQNLHSYGARPRLRRDIAQLLEEPLQTLSET